MTASVTPCDFRKHVIDVTDGEFMFDSRPRRIEFFS
jgi:hypothetical protein